MHLIESGILTKSFALTTGGGVKKFMAMMSFW